MESWLSISHVAAAVQWRSWEICREDWNSEEPQHRVEDQTVVSGQRPRHGGSSQAGCFSPGPGAQTQGCSCTGVNSRCLTKGEPLHYQGATLKSIQVSSHVTVVEFPLILYNVHLLTMMKCF